MTTDWPVLDNGPLTQLSPSLWRVEGALPDMSLRRVCAVARMSTGDLVVHSAICMDEAGMAALEALGPVRWIVVPNRLHRMDAPRYAARYPEAKVLCPPGGRDKVAEVVRLDGTLDEFPEDSVVSFEPLEGVAGQEWVMRVRDPDDTSLVFTDALFNVPHQGGFGGLVLRMMGSSGGPKVTPLARLLLVKEKRALRHTLESLAATPDLRRLVAGHGDVVSEDAAGVLRRVAATL
jgi:hypothetical protein